MKQGSDAPGGAPTAARGGRMEVGAIEVSGVDARAARGLGAAVARAVAEAARAGIASPRSRDSIRLTLPPGANERDIAAAIVRALGEG